MLLSAVFIGSLLPASSLRAQSLNDPNLIITEVPAPALNLPTGMRFLDSDSIFVIEKNSGQVKLIENGLASVVLDLDVNTQSERGLLGIELHPNFATNGWTYLYYSAQTSGSWTKNQLSRFTWNGTSLTNEEQLLSFDFDAAQANGPNHDGGPLTFGPDGKLYGITGDLNRNRAEQNNQGLSSVSSDVGGIFRLNDDGSIPTDNPFVGVGDPAFDRWFAYGIRNSFGMTFDPATGNLWQTENGPQSYDEINLVAPGFNSGWSQLMGPDSRDAQNAATDLVVLPGSAYSDPEFSWASPIAVTSLSFLTGSNWGPLYDDAVLVGANNTDDLYLFRLNDARDGFDLDGALDDLVADSIAERNSLRFGEDFGVVTDVQVGPDGNVYVLSLSEGTIFQIASVPEPSTLALAGFSALALPLLIRRYRKR